MKTVKFSDYEEQIIQAGVARHFKEARAAVIKAEIEKRISISNVNPESYKLTRDDLAMIVD